MLVGHILVFGQNRNSDSQISLTQVELKFAAIEQLAIHEAIAFEEARACRVESVESDEHSLRPCSGKSGYHEISFYCFWGFASRKSFIIGTITDMRFISVTCVVPGKIASLDAGRGCMSPWTSPPPFSRYISAM